MKCMHCALLAQYCICTEISPLSCQPQILIIRHYKESYKASNSARIIQLCIQGVELLDYGIKDKPLPSLNLEGAALLFPPDETSPVYTSSSPPEKIIIVDGTWKQAHKLRKRIEGLDQLPRLPIQSTMTLPRIRTPHFPGGMSTMEACLEALALYNLSETIDILKEYYCLWLEQVRKTTGIREPIRPGSSFKEARFEQDIIDGKIKGKSTLR